jgi:hypothetical protein
MKSADSRRSGMAPEVLPITTTNDAPVYVPPKIVSYTSEEILEQVGPALACASLFCGLT